MTIDLNCDMGESWYDRVIGQDQSIMPYITSCNLACGFHGGDALSMQQTITWALTAGVAIGAHPSYPDRKNFGRQAMDMDPDRLQALLYYQVAALQGLVEQQDGKLRHLKAHGALYHRAATDPQVAAVVVKTAIAFNIPLLYGPPNSTLQQTAKQANLAFATEGFIDRVYEADLRLRSRQLPGAMIEDDQAAAQQALGLVRDSQVIDFMGHQHDLKVQTLCVHGDQPHALRQLLAVQNQLEQAGVVVQRIEPITI